MSKTRTYNIATGLPRVEGPVSSTPLQYTVHAHQAAAESRVHTRLPAVLPLDYTLVEVETMDTSVGEMPIKWVVRCRFDDTRDLVLVIAHNYIVRTVWVNDVHDTHATLKRAHYREVQ